MHLEEALVALVESRSRSPRIPHVAKRVDPPSAALLHFLWRQDTDSQPYSTAEMPPLQTFGGLSQR